LARYPGTRIYVQTISVHRVSSKILLRKIRQNSHSMLHRTTKALIVMNILPRLRWKTWLGNTMRLPRKAT